MIDVIPLTIMGDIDGSARSENGGNAGIVETGGVRGAELGLCRRGTESMSIHTYRTTRRVIYLGAVKRRGRASRIRDDESILREGAQDTTGIVEEFEGLVAGVGDSRGDLQVFQPINVDVGD